VIVSAYCATKRHTSVWAHSDPAGAVSRHRPGSLPHVGGPVKYNAIFQPAAVEKIRLVNTPVRSSDGSRSIWSTRMLVSSLCSTSPCAAWRISSSCAGLITSAVSSPSSHCVAAGSGIPSTLRLVAERAGAVGDHGHRVKRGPTFITERGPTFWRTVFYCR